MVKQSESIGRDKIIKFIRKHSGSGVYLNSSPKYTGLPDLFGGFKSQPFLIEVKKEKGGVVSPAQKAWMKRGRAMGFVVGVVRTVEDFERLFDE